MRTAVAFLTVCLCLAAQPAGAADDPLAGRRYAIIPDLDEYPQDTPQKALSSVVRAIQRKKFDYLLAQLADPEWVDRRVRLYGDKFEAVVEETRTKLTNDPAEIKELNRFVTDGTWDVQETTASAELKDVKDRHVYLKKIGTRWYLQNDQAKKEEK